MIFLMGVNESYTQIRAHIHLMSPLPPIDQLFSTVAQEEHQRTIGNLTNSVDSVSLLAPSSLPYQRRPSNYTGNDRFRKRDNQRPFCTHCNTKGHVIDRCYKLHGYPPGYRNNNSTGSNYSQASKANNTAGTSGTQTAFLASLSTE